MLKTDEGGGVLHIVFRKHRDVPMIPYKWLVNQWGRIWNSTNVSISEIDVTDCKGLGLYLVGQYFAKQPVLRMSYSRGWIGQGVKQRFIHICEAYGFVRAVVIWSKNCRAGKIPTGKSGFQKRFRWKKIPKPKLLIKSDPRYYVYPDDTLRLTSGKQLGFEDYRLYV